MQLFPKIAGVPYQPSTTACGHTVAKVYGSDSISVHLSIWGIHPQSHFGTQILSRAVDGLGLKV